MAEHRLSLGEMVAILETEIKSGELTIATSLSNHDKEYLQSLQKRLDSIKQNELVSDIINSTFGNCHGERACVEGNEDFFLACLVNSQANGQSAQNSLQLMKKLNSCFRCFEAFWPVIRDYHDKLRELSK